MALLSTREWAVAEAVAGIGHTNPFLPERTELERKALGARYVRRQPFFYYSPDVSIEDMFPNYGALRERSQQLAEKMRRRLVAGEIAGQADLLIYEDLVTYVLYARYMSNILELPITQFRTRPQDDIVRSYDDYLRDYRHFFLELPGIRLPATLDADTIFAGLFQIERAFFHVFNNIAGSSLAAARLRASVWQSIFTHDMRRYSRGLYRVMRNASTLICGPSGTGKEMVAEAIAKSQFIEFDSKKREFAADFSKSFLGLNLSAMAPTLIESELFGHRRRSFSDAEDKLGYLDQEVCPSSGTLFLDEVGELDTQIQVKLLRVLQTRVFQRVGETEPRSFLGKIVAATNRDLAVEIEAGRFREDLYWRLCADQIHTPSLKQQLEEVPEDLVNCVRFFATRRFPELNEDVERFTDEAVSWINANLGPDYDWPGNFRELEKCVWNIMIRGHYTPTLCRPSAEKTSAKSEFVKRVANGELSRDQLISQYFSLVYAKQRSYRAAGLKLGVDPRTVQKRVQTKMDPQPARVSDPKTGDGSNTGRRRSRNGRKSEQCT